MPDFDKMKKQTRSGGGPFNMKSYGAGKNPISNSPIDMYGKSPTKKIVNRKGKVNPNSEGNTNTKEGRSKSSMAQKKVAKAEPPFMMMGNMGALTGIASDLNKKSLQDKYNANKSGV
jgi:hypothetical protein